MQRFAISIAGNCQRFVAVCSARVGCQAIGGSQPISLDKAIRVHYNHCSIRLSSLQKKDPFLKTLYFLTLKRSYLTEFKSHALRIVRGKFVWSSSAARNLAKNRRAFSFLGLIHTGCCDSLLRISVFRVIYTSASGVSLRGPGWSLKKSGKYNPRGISRSHRYHPCTAVPCRILWIPTRGYFTPVYWSDMWIRKCTNRWLCFLTWSMVTGGNGGYGQINFSISPSFT